MMEFIYHMTFACLTGAAVGLTFLVVASILKFIDSLFKGNFKDAIVNFFEEVDE